VTRREFVEEMDRLHKYCECGELTERVLTTRDTLLYRCSCGWEGESIRLPPKRSTVGEEATR
jgi:hypothetical protein